MANPGPIERLAGHAADLVKGQVDVILATGDEAVRSAQPSQFIMYVLVNVSPRNLADLPVPARADEVIE
jgi:hypothetical protein